MKRSIFETQPVRMIMTAVAELRDDLMLLYASQASFFTITSIVPFMTLFVAVVGIILPKEIPAEELLASFPLSENITNTLAVIIDELRNSHNITLLSLSSITILWTSSRVFASIRAGVESIYHVEHMNYVRHQIGALLSMCFAIGILAASSGLLLFGQFISEHVGVTAGSIILLIKSPVFILLVSALLTYTYYVSARRSIIMLHSVWLQLPGAILASCAIAIFSKLYSIYISNFPMSSKIYGSLGAVCLIMLWVYFCMIIILMGAEINKLIHYFIGKRNSE